MMHKIRLRYNDFEPAFDIRYSSKYTVEKKWMFSNEKSTYLIQEMAFVSSLMEVDLDLDNSCFLKQLFLASILPKCKPF